MVGGSGCVMVVDLVFNDTVVDRRINLVVGVALVVVVSVAVVVAVAVVVVVMVVVVI